MFFSFRQSTSKSDVSETSANQASLVNAEVANVEVANVEVEPPKVPHKYDLIQPLADLFQLNQEKKALFTRLKKGYKAGQDLQEKNVREALVDIAWDDFIRAYQQQPQYGADANAGNIRFTIPQMKNLRGSIGSEFPMLGPAEQWYKVDGQKRSGPLEAKRANEKSKYRKVKKMTFTGLSSSSAKSGASSSQPTKTQKLPQDSAVGSTQKNKVRIEMDPVLEDLSLKSHLTPANYDAIYAEYKRLLIDEGLSTRVGVLNKFIHLKAFDGKLVS